MLVYQTLDLIKQQYGKIKTVEQNKKQNNYNESCYLGCLFESNLDDYELDFYGYVTNTHYKYILIKNDTH